jgi:hypothetical protein
VPVNGNFGQPLTIVNFVRLLALVHKIPKQKPQSILFKAVTLFQGATWSIVWAPPEIDLLIA